MKQEAMVRNLKTLDCTFFFAHSFKSARQHAEDYLKRNGYDGYQMYTLNHSNYGSKWIIWRSSETDSILRD